MNKIVGILFAISCLVTATVSSRMLGVGIWFWIILATGVFVAASQFLQLLRATGAAAASLLATISVLAVVLTLFAATIGGSFELDGSEGLLVFGFALIAVFGFSLARMNKLSNKRSIE
ncbi:MAG: hypothetical protein DHS20C12_18260 [Pseudohongiella sp.]|nr:MAG: hypothetical protein DHS20C12_18260 [Pseudohongiella sp.]